MKKGSFYKLSILVLALLVLTSVCVFGASALDKSAAIEEVIFNRLPLNSSFDSCMTFVFHDVQEFDYLPNFFSTECSLVPNYTYLKDFETGEIRLLIADETTEIDECGDRLYAIVDGNTIVSVLLDGTDYREIYSSPESHLWSLYSSPDTLLFICDETVYMLDLDTEVATAYGEFVGIKFLYPISDQRFAWTAHDNETYEYNTWKRTNTRIAFNSLFPGSESELLPNMLLADLAVINAVPAQSLPLSEYPVGSYFSNSGRACTHHGSGCDYYGSCGCKSYANSIQCMGFARYVYTKYAHMGSWSANASHESGSRSLGSGSQAKAFLQSLTVGSYIRLASSNNNGHSVILMGTSSTGVTVYEANYDMQCGVGTRTLSYATFASQYPTVVETYCHKFSGSYATYSSQYHKVFCNLSGCNGYLLREHFAENPGSNATCIACGYVGNISNGMYSAAHDEE